MKISLPYGRKRVAVDIPFPGVTVLEPRFIAGLADERKAFADAVRSPIGSRPLRDIIRPGEKVAVLIPDITRPFPSGRILPWLFDELPGVAPSDITIVIGTGSHRACSKPELDEMLGHGVLRRYRVVNHDAHDLKTMLAAGKRDDGASVYMNKEYAGAGRRIIMGFIEPHFMAGFSGGYKAAMPGVADINSILYYHRAEIIADPRSTWGVLENNPTQAIIRRLGALMPVDFCVNVTLNRERAITGFFCGDPLKAHLSGCEFAKETAMTPCARRYPVVITTNGGYPLDQNLYQSVKGMSAAAQIVEEGGLIVAVCECADGFPAHGNFAKLLFEHDSPRAILDTVMKPGFSMFDQWEAQLLAMIRLKAKIALYSALPAADVRRAHMEPVGNLDNYLAELARRLGTDGPAAVMPEGPMVIPYLD